MNWEGTWVAQLVKHLTSLRLRSWSHSSRVRSPLQGLCWQLGVWSLLWILSASLSAPPRSLSLSLSLSQKQTLKKFKYELRGKDCQNLENTLTMKDRNQNIQRQWRNSELTERIQSSSTLQRIIINTLCFHERYCSHETRAAYYTKGEAEEQEISQSNFLCFNYCWNKQPFNKRIRISSPVEN